MRTNGQDCVFLTFQLTVADQKVFWVATAPLSGAGHVNVSPKGGKYFGIIDPVTFWYHDLSGSGNETIAHLHEPRNGRITIMFNAFEGAPKIARKCRQILSLSETSADICALQGLWGKGTVCRWTSQYFPSNGS